MLTTSRPTWWHRVWTCLAPVSASLVGAAILLYFDIVETGYVACSTVVCPVWFLISAAKAAIQRPKWRLGITRLLVPLLTLALAHVNYAAQEKIATHNAEQIIRACESYRATNGSYPDRLEQLIPRYLRSVPRAKYCRDQCSFEYRSEPGRHKVVWHPFPGVPRRFYILEERKWRFVD